MFLLLPPLLLLLLLTRTAVVSANVDTIFEVSDKLRNKFRVIDNPLSAAAATPIAFQVPPSCKLFNNTVNICKVSEKRFEQEFQLQFFNRKRAHQHQHQHGPLKLSCVPPPPADFVFPSKPSFDMPVHFPNFYVKDLEGLGDFNAVSSKNHYHLNAKVYDEIWTREISFAADYIPFQSKIRLVLDVGAGGGSFGLLMNKMYNTQSISIVFPDWPYCEYITERGGLCMLVDGTQPMPFAKGSFDLIHASWIYHNVDLKQLVDILMEMNRMLRPGGYLWMDDGMSKEQYRLFRSVFQELGYKPLIVAEQPQSQQGVKFGNNNYEILWYAILEKPSYSKDLEKCNI